MYFHDTLSFIIIGRFGLLIPLLGAGDRLKTFSTHTCRVEIEDRNLELTCLTFGQGDWKTANRFPSFDSFMSAIISYITFILFADAERIKFTNKLSNVNSHVQPPPMNETHFCKIKGYLTKIFKRILLRKLDIRCKTQTTSTTS